MKKFAYVFPVALFIFAATLPAHATLQGCVDSPENPTAVLGLVVSVASIGFVHLRNRIGIRRNSDHK